MGESAPQERGDDRVIRTPADVAAALAEQFVANAEAGEHEANDEIVRQLGEWKRGNR